jgi:exonuclease VII small subunit
LVDTYRLIGQQLTELRREVQATPPLLGLLGRFTKARSIIKKLNEAVDKLDKAITHLEAGVRISQQAELARNRREVHEEEKILRRAMGFDSEDETVVVGRWVAKHTLLRSSFL